MNFPDLETSRIIGPEFPDSEFVYVQYFSLNSEKNEWAGPLSRANHTGTQYKTISAPTCEELGSWLVNHYSKNIVKLKKKELLELQLLFFKCAYSWSETQARAEAVNLILKENE